MPLFEYVWDGALVIALAPLLIPAAVGNMVQRVYTYTTRKGKLSDLPTIKSMIFPMSDLRLKPGRIEALLAELKKEDGTFPPLVFFGPHIDGTPAVGVTSVSGLRTIFTNDKLFPKYDPFYDVARDVAGEDGGLVAMKGEVWKKERRLLTPHFHFDRLTDGVPKITSVCSSMWKELKSSPPSSLDSVDVNKVFSDMALAIIIKYAFGDRVPVRVIADAFEKIVAMLPTYMLELTLFGRVAAYLPFSPNLSILKGRRMIKNCIEEVVKKSMRERAEDKDKKGKQREGRSDFSLIDSIIDMASGVDDTKVINHAVSEGILFLFAGQDTTSNTLSFAIDFLSLPENMHYQEKAREEAFRVFGGMSGFEEAARTDVNELHVCEQIINETLRLTPAVPFVDRRAAADIHICGKLIPKGTAVLPFFSAVQRHGDSWTDADRFNPDRFSAEIEHDNFSFAPFSAGRRNCIGQKLAMIEAKLALASFLMVFRAESITQRQCEWHFEATMRPHNMRTRLIPI
uniref:Cytochrome P450 n=1 Tax=Palpitomonas bilix TaxID=652834 RepID=A0A7S3GDJ8_9EUKA